MDGCSACDLAAGRVPLPGGVIHEAEHWLGEHCVGPLGVGALIVKPKRHVTRVSELTEGEAAELGPLLRRSAAVVDELVRPEAHEPLRLVPSAAYRRTPRTAQARATSSIEPSARAGTVARRRFRSAVRGSSASDTAYAGAGP